MLSKMGLGKKCLAAYEKAVALDPTNLNARSSLMTVYQQAPGMMGGGGDKALVQAAAIKQLDETRGRVAYAMFYIGEKKYAEALTELEEALKSAPDHYAALYQFGRLAALTGERIDRGMEALKKCLTLPPTPGFPGHEAAQWRLGNLWEKKGDKQAARAAYQAALAINSGFQQAIDALKKLD
jgi:tetratricopeptide (TPR) repeat protein